MNQSPDRGTRDGERINLDDDQELRFWLSELEVSNEQLREAVGAVGPRAQDVRVYLEGRFTRF